VYRYRSRRDHSRPRVYKSFSCVLRDPGSFPFVMEKEEEEKKERPNSIAASSSRRIVACALPAKRYANSLSEQTAFILVRTRAPMQPSAVIYLSWFEFNGHRHCAYMRVSGPIRPSPLVSPFFFLLFRNGITRATRSGYRCYIRWRVDGMTQQRNALYMFLLRVTLNIFYHVSYFFIIKE